MFDRRSFVKSAALGGIGMSLFQKTLATSLRNGGLSKSDFGDFSWGITIAAAQNEGAWNTDGRGESIWDRFAHTKRKVDDGSTPDIACDFYNNYKNDIDLLKSLGFDSFRFSISWSRILPDGKGAINQKGIDYYNRVIDYCLQQGVTPWLMLYHWDLPQKLQDEGGWCNRDITGWFADYVAVCAKHFGDRVKNWLVLNEPLGFTSFGYLIGIHAPSKYGVHNFLPAVHHAALCQSIGGKVLRESRSDLQIGTTFSCSPVEPLNDSDRHVNAARRLDAFLNRLFIEPSLGMGYPIADLPFIERIEKYIKPSDIENLKFDFDFIGLQTYFRVVAKFGLIPFVWAADDKDHKSDESKLTTLNWEVFPEGIYKVVKQFAQYPVKKIYITESGASFNDLLIENAVNDTQRVDYFKEHIEQLLRAKKEFDQLKGYFVWTLTDNWEWAGGYTHRFGLVYNNHETQQRIVKKSGLWFKEFLSNDELLMTNY